MKYSFFFFLLFFCLENTFAQKISQRRLRKHLALVAESKHKHSVLLSLDTIFNKGLPYAILKRKKQLPYHEFAVFSLGNEKLIDIHTRTGINRDHTMYYAFFFIASGKTAEPEKYYGFAIEKAVVEYDLVEGEKINPFSEFKFLKKFPPKFSDTTIVTYIEDPVSTKDFYEPVQRDRSKEIYVGDGAIQQDFKLVGHYKITDGTIRIYLPGGMMVAEAFQKETGSATWRLLSLKDKKNWTMSISPGNELKEIVGFLMEKKYL